MDLKSYYGEASRLNLSLSYSVRPCSHYSSNELPLPLPLQLKELEATTEEILSSVISSDFDDRDKKSSGSKKK